MSLLNCRCIGVNPQIEHSFTGSLIYPQAILIEDINNDGKNELVVGTANGEILIYKGSLASPWLGNSKNIGCITCIAFNSFTDSKQKYLIVHDAIGYVYFYSINQVPLRKRYASAVSSAESHPSDWKLELCNIYQTKLLINPKFILIDDLYNNGYKKMIIGYSDRLVRLYGWQNTTSMQNNNINTNNTNFINNKHSNSKASIASQANTNYMFQESGKIILEQSWELPEQIGSIKIFKDALDKKFLLVSLPDCRVVVLNTITNQSNIGNESNSSSFSSLTQISLSHQINIPSVEEIVNFSSSDNDSCIKGDTAKPSFLISNVFFKNSNNYAFLISSNGELFFFKINIGNVLNRTPIWRRNLNVFIMKCYKIDINKDGNEELLLATPDGQIFIINCEGDVLCLDLGEPVKLFHIGLFSIESFYSTNLIENSICSEVNLHQSNPEFELALNSSPIQSANVDEPSINKFNSNINQATNSLCLIFVSALTTKINLLHAETIISYSRLKLTTHLKYKCKNILYLCNKLQASKLNKLLKNSESNHKKHEILNKILYSF